MAAEGWKWRSGGLPVSARPQSGQSGLHRIKGGSSSAGPPYTTHKQATGRGPFRVGTRKTLSLRHPPALSTYRASQPDGTQPLTILPGLQKFGIFLGHGGAWPDHRGAVNRLAGLLILQGLCTKAHSLGSRRQCGSVFNRAIHSDPNRQNRVPPRTVTKLRLEHLASRGVHSKRPGLLLACRSTTKPRNLLKLLRGSLQSHTEGSLCTADLLLGNASARPGHPS